LRALDDQGKVRSFGIQPADINISLEDGYQEIRYGPTGISARLADPQADEAQVFASIAEVFRILEPERLGLARANLQFLEELAGGYEELRKSQPFVAPPSDISISDWALLINPDIKDAQPPWGGALEFGIVSGDEVEPRLARAVGKLSSDQIGEVSDRIAFPAVAFFADSNFATTTAIDDTGEGLLQATLTAWTTIRQKSSELAAKIKNDYAGANPK
jgi:hypothetical protein